MIGSSGTSTTSSPRIDLGSLAGARGVYFGGGTPSHVSPHLLGRVLDALRNRHGIAPDAEISLEANPEDFGEDRESCSRSVSTGCRSAHRASMTMSWPAWVGVIARRTSTDRSTTHAGQVSAMFHST